MKSASLAEIRKELKTLHPDEVLELCGQLARYKKDNKEFLNYLLFEARNQDAYVEAIKQDVEAAFAATNTSSFYLAKKSIRKALRIANKYAKYSDVPETELEVLIFFCEQLRTTELELSKSKVLLNLYNRQLMRIEKIFDSLHEDLQFDFQDKVEALKR
ncbi:hypothetical protein ACFLR1_03475 [Bacteroidota bacterium]